MGILAVSMVAVILSGCGELQEDEEEWQRELEISTARQLQPIDTIQAYAWLNIAAGQGFQLAKEARESMAESMSRGENSRAQQLARECWQACVLPFRN